MKIIKGDNYVEHQQEVEDIKVLILSSKKCRLVHPSISHPDTVYLSKIKYIQFWMYIPEKSSYRFRGSHSLRCSLPHYPWSKFGDDP